MTGPAPKAGGMSPKGCLGCLGLVAAVFGLATWLVLATQNSGSTPAGPVLTPYETAMNTLTANCTQSPQHLENMISAAYAKEVKAGKAVSVSSTALGFSYLTAGNTSPQDCQDEYALYLQQQGVK